MKTIPYAQWYTMLVLIMIGAGVFGTELDTVTVRPYNFNLDHDAFRDLYDQGYTPFEAYLCDINEGGE